MNARRLKASAVLLSVVIVHALASQARAATNGAIIFACGNDIATVRADGTGKAVLVKNGKLPQWSPDGRRVAFVRTANGVPAVYLCSARGGNVRMLVDNASEPAWSPDGTTIAFERDLNIFTIGIDGTGLTALTSSWQNQQPAWSPDGAKIAFSRYENGPSGQNIYAMDADGANMTNVSQDDYDSYNPAWSPDGTRIVFEQTIGGIPAVYIMNADGSNEKLLHYGINPFNSDDGPVFSPDGRKILFADDHSDFKPIGIYQLYTMTPAGRKVHQLFKDSVPDMDPSWKAA